MQSVEVEVEVVGYMASHAILFAFFTPSWCEFTKLRSTRWVAAGEVGSEVGDEAEGGA